MFLIAKSLCACVATGRTHLVTQAKVASKVLERLSSVGLRQVCIVWEFSRLTGNVLLISVICSRWSGTIRDLFQIKVNLFNTFLVKKNQNNGFSSITGPDRDLGRLMRLVWKGHYWTGFEYFSKKITEKVLLLVENDIENTFTRRTERCIWCSCTCIFHTASWGESVNGARFCSLLRLRISSGHLLKVLFI